MPEGLYEEDSLTAEALLDRLGGLEGPEARSIKLAAWLEAVGPRRGAIWLEWLCAVGSGTSHLREKARLILSELPWVMVKLGAQGARLLRDAARSLGLNRAEGLMGEVGPSNSNLGSFGPELAYLRGVTLGERRTLARGRSSKWLERLLWDPDPVVIRRLLANPRLTETEVLKIASRCPVSPAILREIALSGKWISRYRVKLALVLNPFCPISISMALVELVLIQDLKRVVEKQDLHETLREKARALLRERIGFQDKLQ